MSKGKDMFRGPCCSTALVAVFVWNEEAEGARMSEGWGAGGFRSTGKEGFSFSGHPEAIRWMALPTHSAGSWVALQSRQTGTVPMNWPLIPTATLPAWGSWGRQPRVQVFPSPSPPFNPHQAKCPFPALNSSSLSSPSSRDGSLLCAACPCSIISQVLLCRVLLKAALPQPLQPTLFLFLPGGLCS